MAQDRSMVAVSAPVPLSEMPADLAAALADLFEAYSDARTDYGRTSPRAKLWKAVELMG